MASVTIENLLLLGTNLAMMLLLTITVQCPEWTLRLKVAVLIDTLMVPVNLVPLLDVTRTLLLMFEECV